MSIVNQMLQDLNARSANPQHQVQDEMFAPHSAPQVNPITKYRIATGCLIICAIIIATYTMTSNSYIRADKDQQLAPSAEDASVLLSAAQKAVLTTPTDAIITTSQGVAEETQTVSLSSPSTPPIVKEPQMSVSQVTEQLALSTSTLAPPISPSSMHINTSNGELRFVAGLQDKARLALQSNDIPKAIQALQALLAAKPFDHSSRLLLARLYYQSGQPDVTLNLLQVAPNEDELSAEFLSFRASLYSEASEHRYAIDDYKVLSRLEPNNVRWQLGIAIAYDQLNDYADAKYAYEQVKLIRDLPTNVDTFIAERISILKELI